MNHTLYDDGMLQCVAENGYTFSDRLNGYVRILGTCSGNYACTNCPPLTNLNLRGTSCECIENAIMNRRETACVCAPSYTVNDDETECVKILGTCSGMGPCTNCPINSIPNEKRTTCECFKNSYLNEEMTECICDKGFTLNDAGNACIPVLGSCIFMYLWDTSSPCNDCPPYTHSNKRNTTCECNSGCTQLQDTSCGCQEGYTFNDQNDGCLKIIGDCDGIFSCTCPPKAVPISSYTTCVCIDHAMLSQDKTACECDEGYNYVEELYSCEDVSRYPTGERSQTISMMRANFE